ncbi:MAG: M24 family metallopeptidase, partial [Candidatus Dormibacterales bacterium]
SWIEDVRGYPGRSPLEAGLVADLLSGLGLGQATIGWELGPGQRPALPHSTFEEVRRRLPRARFVDGSPVLEACRLVKSAAEVLRVEEACRVASRGHRLARERMRPGLSVAECERLVLAAMLEAGADADPPPVLWFGGAARSHVYAGGEVLQLDFAVSYRGYRADLTRRSSFGPPAAVHLRDHEDITKIQDAVLQEVRAGAPVRALVGAYDRAARAAGLPALRAGDWIGHGLGLDLLEPPALDSEDETVLVPGMIITPEPWFLREGRLVMVEETVLVAEAGARRLAPSGGERLEVIGG